MAQVSEVSRPWWLRWLGTTDTPFSRDLKLIAWSGYLMWVGFAIYQAVYTNFLVSDLHIQPDKFGFLESLRELPGFLMVGMVALTVRFRESRVCGFALLLMGVGMLGFVGAYNLWFLLIASTLMSTGFHLSMPLTSSLTLKASERRLAGRRLGQLSAISSVGSLTGMIFVLLVVGVIGLRASFVPAGLAILAGGCVLYFMRDRHTGPRMRLLVRRKYGIYYVLTLLDGSRRQIFSTFAVLALVRLYGLDVHAVTWLLLFNSLVSIVSTPPIGRLIDRFGERRLLVVNYTFLVFLFAGYALVKNVWLLGILYCIDNAFFGFSLAISSYLKKIAPYDEVTPSLAMGGTVNHIAAVGVPAVGGLLWASYGYQVTFLAGAATCILSVVAALAIPTLPHLISASGSGSDNHASQAVTEVVKHVG